MPRVYDARTGALTATLGSPRPFIHDAVITSSDRRVIVVVDEEVEVWDLEPVRLASTFRMFHPLLGRLAVSPDGRLIAMSGARTVAVWDVEHQRQIVELTGHSEDVRAVAFTPDGRSLVTAAPDTTIRIHPAEAFLPFDELLARARTNVSRSLSVQELQALTGQ